MCVPVIHKNDYEKNSQKPAKLFRKVGLKQNNKQVYASIVGPVATHHYRPDLCQASPPRRRR